MSMQIIGDKKRRKVTDAQVKAKSGEVTTWKMTPEELEQYKNKTKRGNK